MHRSSDICAVHFGHRHPALIDKAQRMYDSRQFTMAEIAASCGVTPMTIYRNIHSDTATRATGTARDTRWGG